MFSAIRSGPPRRTAGRASPRASGRRAAAAAGRRRGGRAAAAARPAAPGRTRATPRPPRRDRAGSGRADPRRSSRCRRTPRRAPRRSRAVFAVATSPDSRRHRRRSTSVRFAAATDRRSRRVRRILALVGSAVGCAAARLAALLRATPRRRRPESPRRRSARPPSRCASRALAGIARLGVGPGPHRHRRARASPVPPATKAGRLGARDPEGARVLQRARREGDGSRLAARRRDRRGHRPVSAQARSDRARRQRADAGGRASRRRSSSWLARGSPRGRNRHVRGKIVFFNKRMERTLGRLRIRRAVDVRGEGRVARRQARRGRRPDPVDRDGLEPHAAHGRHAARAGTCRDPRGRGLGSRRGPARAARAARESPSASASRSVAGTGPTAESANVIGEIPGAEKPEEIVLLGAHLDSWDLGTGAIDDAAGCGIIIEAARLIGSLRERPRRTIRVVLFANEENGLAGGRAYAADARGGAPAARGGAGGRQRHGPPHRFLLERGAVRGAASSGRSPRSSSRSGPAKLIPDGSGGADISPLGLRAFRSSPSAGRLALLRLPPHGQRHVRQDRAGGARPRDRGGRRLRLRRRVDAGAFREDPGREARVTP